MAENNVLLRSYEVSIWTLQDSFVTVLKASDTEHKGAIQDGILEIADDGTENLTFNVPKFYTYKGLTVPNPLWQYILDGHLVANMHKVKLIFNKATEDEAVFEFLVISVTEVHETNLVYYEIKGEGLAFNELGKLGYKISLSSDDFNEENKEWFDLYHEDDNSEAPLTNLLYWNDRIFYYTDEDGNKQKRYMWDYIVDMDWSDSSIGGEKDTDKVYDDEYVTSWNLDIFENKLFPRKVEKSREKARLIDVKESNIYNITLTIAEKFGIYCKYVYDYDENYHIIGKHVVYYNNNYKDTSSHIDITYPYNTSSIKRILDNSELSTKLFVQPISDDTVATNLISIANSDANKSKEDYLLNFDYLYKINSITKELYDAVSEFEVAVAKYNYKLEWIGSRIAIYEEKLTDAMAKVAFCENAIVLDDLRINEAKKLKDNLTDGDGYIEITEANPQSLWPKSDPNTESLVSVNIRLLGVDPATVKLYQTKDVTKKVGEGRLTNPLTTGTYVYDDYGFLVGIDNILVLELEEKTTGIYMTCSYSPQNYYDKVIETWTNRKKKDEDDLNAALEEERSYAEPLFGCDVDYARVEWALVEKGSAGTSIEYHKDEGLDVVLNEINVVNESYVGDAILGDGHGLYCMQDIYLQRKEVLVNKFERLMGPALREGYWTPDDYEDYGTQWSDRFAVDGNGAKGYAITVNSTNNPNMIKFIWDNNNIFENEPKLQYEVGADQELEYYFALDLTRFLDIVARHTKDLCLFYYDPRFILTYEDMLDEQIACEERAEKLRLGDYTDEREILAITKTDPEEEAAARAEAAAITIDYLQTRINLYKTLRPILLENAKRWVTIGTECEFAYIQLNWNHKLYPALLITDCTKYDNDTWLALNGRREIVTRRDNYNLPIETSIVSLKGINKANTEYEYSYDFRPYLGVITTTQVTVGEGATAYTYPKLVYTKLSDYITDNDIIIGTSQGEKYNNNNSKIFVGSNYSIVAPRIVIDSLYVKPSSILLAINEDTLKITEHYSDFIEIDSVADKDKYFINIKPSVFIGFGDVDKTVYISYNISNAADEIYLDALKIARENSIPKVSYEVALNAFNKEATRVAYNFLRRVVFINDADMLFDNVAGYISKLTLDLDHPWEDLAEIKNYETKFEDLFSTIVALTEQMKKNEDVISFANSAFAAGGILKGDILSKSMLKANLSYAFNQGTLTIDEENGIWGISDDGVIAFRGGGIFTATEKDENGEWKWNTGILPTGINADLLTGGQVDTNKIHIYSGDLIRFQWNGKGLFAYKDAEANEATTTEAANDYLNGYNVNQYVVYNEDGMALVARKGSYILKKNNLFGTSDYVHVGYLIINGHEEEVAGLPEEIKRVEISWEGLILRNYINDKVFYADASTGNLHLTGIVEAMAGGHIAGWTIADTSLYSGTNDSYVALSIGTSNPNNSLDSEWPKYRIWAGKENPIQAPFSVQADGTLTATQGTIGGWHIEPDRMWTGTYDIDGVTIKTKTFEITNLGTGQIGCWIIAADRLYTQTGQDTSTYTALGNASYTNAGTTTIYSIWAGAKNPLSANFSVTNKGFLTAKSGIIGGWNINGDSLYNGTVSLYSSGHDNLRIKVGDNFKVYSDGSVHMAYLIVDGKRVDFTTAFNNAVRLWGTWDGLDFYAHAQFYSNSALTKTLSLGASVEILEATVGKGAFTNGIYRATGTAWVITTIGGASATFKGIPIDVSAAAPYADGWMLAYGKIKPKTIEETTTKITIPGADPEQADSSIDLTPRYNAGWKAAYDVSSHSGATIDPGDSVRINVPSSTPGSGTYVTVRANSGTSPTPGSCFDGNTLIRMADNSFKPIKLIKLGDMVLSYNKNTLNYASKEVIATYAHKNANNILEMHFSSGDVIIATNDHPFLTTKGWRAIKPKYKNGNVDYLEIGDEIVSLNNKTITLDKIIYRPDLTGITVYNFTVEDYHTYMVEKMVVHNDKITPD